MHDVLCLWLVAEIVTSQCGNPGASVCHHAAHQSLSSVCPAHIVLGSSGDKGLVSVVASAERRLIRVLVVVAPRIHESVTIRQDQIAIVASGASACWQYGPVALGCSAYSPPGRNGNVYLVLLFLCNFFSLQASRLAALGTLLIYFQPLRMDIPARPRQ